MMTDLTIQQPVTKTYYGSKLFVKSSARSSSTIIKLGPSEDSM